MREFHTHERRRSNVLVSASKEDKDEKYYSFNRHELSVIVRQEIFADKISAEDTVQSGLSKFSR